LNRTDPVNCDQRVKIAIAVLPAHVASTATDNVVLPLPYPQRFCVSFLPVGISLVKHIHKCDSRFTAFDTVTLRNKFISRVSDTKVSPVQRSIRFTEGKV